MRGIVDSVTVEELGAFLEENPTTARIIVDKGLRAQRAECIRKYFITREIS